MASPSSDEPELRPFEIAVPDHVLEDLHSRLTGTRWPDQFADVGWDYGANLDYVASICDHWAHRYDWRRVEAELNAYPQFTMDIDGEQLHVMHIRSRHEHARPLMLVHGWPGSLAEFLPVIDLLTDPTAHGGSVSDAFHLVIPSLPGFGFSGPTRRPGVHMLKMGSMLDRAMAVLGYERYAIHGTDWGAIIANAMTSSHPHALTGVHLTFLMAQDPGTSPLEELSDIERADLDANAYFQTYLSGYSAIQGTRPQTLAYGLSDSPAGLAAWILDRFHLSTDCRGDLDAVIDRDLLLTNVMIYWVTETINSSMRIYYEAGHMGPEAFAPPPANDAPVPIAHALYPAEAMRFPRSWVEAQHNIVRWTRMDRGGHFAAMEQPESLVADIRGFYADLDSRLGQ